MVSKLILLFLAIVPWSALIFKKADIWHAQGHFVQMGILVLFCVAFFDRPKNVQPLNRSLGAFFGWAGLVTGYWWIKIFVETKHYPVKIFMPFFNLLCLIILYKIITEYLNKESIEKIIKWLKYSVIFVLLYCVIQHFALDEFFREINTRLQVTEMVGIMGNVGHSAGLLAICQPLFFEKSRVNILSLILLWLIIIIDGSASGLFVGISVVLIYLLLNKKYLWAGVGLGLSIASFCLIYLKYSVFFDDSHRFNIWLDAFEMLRTKAITGYGLGYFGAMGIKLSNSHFQHLHNEWLQITFELGIVGLMLAVWVVKDYFTTLNRLKIPTTIRLATIFSGFCLLCLFSFPAHLWVISVLAVFAYASIYAINS